MNDTGSLGEFELCVLLALVRVAEDAYGMRIRQEIEARTGRDVSIGAVYVTLARLEKKGLVRSDIAAPIAKQGGRRRRVYEITHVGRTATRRATSMIENLAQGIDLGLEPR